MLRSPQLLVLTALMGMWGLLVAASGPEPEYRPTETIATFQDREINITESWEDAKACLIWREDRHITECFATEAQLDARIAELRAEREDVGAVGDFKHHRGAVATEGSQCSGYLRLYSGTGHSGTVLYLQGRFQWHNLADFGFDQQTSSYRIGPCSSYFADYAAGGGDWYPTSLTGAYDQAASMQSGWNNDVSSVYIN